MMRRLFITGMMLIAATAARGATASVEDILARMEKSEAGIQAVRFAFTQEIAYTVTKEKQTNSGEAVFQKPANIRVCQKSPLEQIITTNGKKVWIYTPAYRQVLVDSWKKWAASSLVPASLLNVGQNYKELKEKYTFSLAGTEGKDYVLLLTPRTKEAWRLKLWIDSDTLVPAKAVLFGDTVTVTTETIQYKINPPLEKGLFTFSAPAGVEVLNVP
jgi:outer membrane lipoprotein carrier protein